MKHRRNDDERAMWVDNDKGLYHWWKEYGGSQHEFIRDNREELDRLIDRELNREPSQ